MRQNIENEGSPPFFLHPAKNSIHFFQFLPPNLNLGLLGLLG